MMKRYNSLTIVNQDTPLLAPIHRALSVLGTVTPYSKGVSLSSTDLLAIDYQSLGDLNAIELFSDALAGGCSLAVLNLDDHGRELLMKLTGAKPCANSFGAVYRRLYRPGAANHLFHSYIPNYSQRFRDFVDDRQGGFERTFESYVYAGLKRHFRAIEEVPLRSPQGAMTPPFLDAPFSHVTASTFGVIFPMTGAQELAYTNVDITSDFYFYHSDANQDQTQNQYLVVVVITLENMTPGGVVIYQGNNGGHCCQSATTYWQYTQVFSYGATVWAAQGFAINGACMPFPNGVTMGTTSPPPCGFQQNLTDLLASPTPVMNVTTQSGPAISSVWAPTYSNTISQTDSPNLQWFTVSSNDDVNLSGMGATFVMPQNTWGGGNTNAGVPNTSTMTMEFINYFTFGESLATGEPPNLSLPVYFFLGANGSMTEDDYQLMFGPNGEEVTIDPITANMTVEPWTTPNYWNSGYFTYYVYDLVKATVLQKT
jgi:hypothetical protein